jgi:hypothetical protein
MRRTHLALVIGLFLVPCSLAAHHAASTKYDMNKPITLKGTVTLVEWKNPHIYYYLDVKDSAGKVTNWAVEGSTPNQLFRAGWRKDMLKPGTEITVQGFMARKEGLTHINGRNVTLPDGRRIFAGSPEDGFGTR